MNKYVERRDLGYKDYKQTWDYQEQLFKGIVDTKIKNRREELQLPTNNYFLFVEHPHVYTLGKSGDLSNLLLNESQLQENIHKYLRFLEEMIILTLAEYGLKAERSKGETGVWLDVGTPFARKICAMGVRASRWVTMHGFALNVNANLGYFDNIIPCGIRGKAVTSLNVELGIKEVPVEEVKEKLLKHFANLFEAKFTS